MKPIVFIGGLGGSGTRIVAEALMEMDVHLGDELNNSYDYLLYTRLFKNPDWYSNANKEQITDRLRLFKKCLERKDISPIEKRQIIKASRANPLIKTSFFYTPTPSPRTRDLKVGWKEPNSWILLDYILSIFGDIKYVHVIRNANYMMTSRNKQQLINWGELLFNLQKSQIEKQPEIEQLNYWIAANDRVKNIASQRKDARIYFLNYDRFCNNPTNQIASLMTFLDIPILRSKVINLANSIVYNSTQALGISSIPEHLQDKVSEIESLEGCN